MENEIWFEAPVQPSQLQVEQVIFYRVLAFIVEIDLYKMATLSDKFFCIVVVGCEHKNFYIVFK